MMCGNVQQLPGAWSLGLLLIVSKHFADTFADSYYHQISVSFIPYWWEESPFVSSLVERSSDVTELI